MRALIALTAAVLIACSSSRDREGEARAIVADAICARLADAMELRARAHEAALPRFHKWVHADTMERDKYELDPAVSDVYQTHHVASHMGRECTDDIGPSDCDVVWAVDSLANVDESLRRTRNWIAGVRGHGPCARPSGKPRHWPDCTMIAYELMILDDNSEVTQALEGAATPFDRRGLPSRYARYASDTMARWRAELDYALAIAPVCIPTLYASCVSLRSGLTDARADDLAARLRALQAAYLRHTPCPLPGAAAGDAQSSR